MRRRRPSLTTERAERFADAQQNILYPEKLTRADLSAYRHSPERPYVRSEEGLVRTARTSSSAACPKAPNSSQIRAAAAAAATSASAGASPRRRAIRTRAINASPAPSVSTARVGAAFTPNVSPTRASVAPSRPRVTRTHRDPSCSRCSTIASVSSGRRSPRD